MSHSDKRLASDIGALLLIYAREMCPDMDLSNYRYGQNVEEMIAIIRPDEFSWFFQSFTGSAKVIQNVAPIPDSVPGGDDVSALVAFSQAFHATADESQTGCNRAMLMQWQIMFDLIWAAICRRALCAGLTKAEGQKTTQEVLMAAANEMTKAGEGSTVETFSGRVWHYARSFISDAVRQKHKPQPYYASVAWRQKYTPMGPG